MKERILGVGIKKRWTVLAVHRFFI